MGRRIMVFYGPDGRGGIFINYFDVMVTREMDLGVYLSLCVFNTKFKRHVVS